MQARCHDPAVGRFLSIDPVRPGPGNTFNFNRYGYASSNPLLNIDPDGRQVFHGYGSSLVIFFRHPWRYQLFDNRCVLSNKSVDAGEVKLGSLKRLIFERPISKHAWSLFKESIDREVHDSPESPSGIFARYLRARAYEEGLLVNQNIDAAMEDYSFIMDHGGDLRSEGMVSCARLLHWKDKSGNAEKALSLCAEAIDLDSNVRAMMFMGYIFEHSMRDFESAATWYLRAFKNKQPWGLRFYASVQLKRGKFVVGVLSHVAATILGPIMTIRHGRKGAFKL